MYTQIAIQGPKAMETLQKLTDTDLSVIKNYWFTWGKVAGFYNVLIARTGYTGEDGFEIYVPSDEMTSESMWKQVFAAGEEFGIVPAGLGARNTLRLESSMALYGHEISDEINVFEAGLNRYCKLDKEADFVGKAALVAASAAEPKRKLVGLEMVDRGIARDGYLVRTLEGEEIGVVTSGSPSPTLKKNIAMAFVPPAEAALDNVVAIEIRGNLVKAKVIPTPFYKRVRTKTATV
jgi:aminomethyltransferase